MNTYDLVIIGAGPTGLAAAIYAGREDLSTLVVDKAIAGGLAAITDRIDNYPGFDEGISGIELADRLQRQATRFGAEVRTFTEVTGFKRMDDVIVLATPGGELRARAVLVATGSTYRVLGVPGEAEQIGRHVHFCATCDGPLYKGRDLVVVGGGNSAVQETIFLARFARKITVLVRGTELKASAVLIDQITALKNVEVIFNTPVDRIESTNTKLTGVVGTSTVTGNSTTYPSDGVFVFIGLLPNTDIFEHQLDHDERNFLITNQHFGTNLPGVFVAGDVRSGSTWQIAAAIGEGVSAALAIREYLDEL